MHIGVFILLLLSGERNFGVRLNKPYSVRVPMDIPVFTGTHADLLIIVSMVLPGSACACLIGKSVFMRNEQNINSSFMIISGITFVV